MVSDLWWGQSYCQSCTGGTFDDGKCFMLNMTVVSFVAFRILEKYYAGLSDSTFILWDNASPILLIGAWQDSIMALVGSTFPDVPQYHLPWLWLFVFFKVPIPQLVGTCQ